MEKGRIGEWLELKYLEWQTSQGKRQSLEKFANYLGVERMTLNRWMNGNNRPDLRFVDSIADKLGDEIYDLMEIKRPDPALRYIIRQWPALTDEQRRTLKDQAERYSDDATR